jgi:hypothetical protein
MECGGLRSGLTMVRLLLSLCVLGLLLVGCGGGSDEPTTNASQGVAALANTVGGSLKVADSYARSTACGAPDCTPDSSSKSGVYAAALSGCIKALRKADPKGNGYALLYTDQKLTPAQQEIYRQAVEDCRHP